MFSLSMVNSPEAMCLVNAARKIQVRHENTKMEKHRTRLPGEVQSLHRKNNGEGRAHPTTGPKDPSSPVIG